MGLSASRAAAALIDFDSDVGHVIVAESASLRRDERAAILQQCMPDCSDGAGTLTYADVAPSADWEVSHKWGKSSATASRDEAALTALKREVEAAVAAFAKELGSRV